MNIYLTRHGESQWNVEDRLQGSLDSTLTKKGYEDSHKLKAYLQQQGVKIDCIYSSPSVRALETANIIAADRGLTIRKHSALKEMNVGSWQGQRWATIKRKYPTEYFRYWNQPEQYQGQSGGEDFHAVHNRLRFFVEEMMRENHGENVLIVSHGVILNSIFNYYQKQPLSKLWIQPIVAGASLSLVKKEADAVKLIYRNQQTHLE